MRVQEQPQELTAATVAQVVVAQNGVEEQEGEEEGSKETDMQDNQKQAPLAMGEAALFKPLETQEDLTAMESTTGPQERNTFQERPGASSELLL